MADGKIVTTIFSKAPQEQRLLPHREKRVTTITTLLGNRRERQAILHRDAPGGLVNRHSRTREMFEGHLPHPAVGGVLHRDRAPRMVLVLWIFCVERGFEPE